METEIFRIQQQYADPQTRHGAKRRSIVDTRQVVNVLDLAAENPNEPIAKFGGARTILGVPMLKENEAIGVIGIYARKSGHSAINRSRLCRTLPLRP